MSAACPSALAAAIMTAPGSAWAHASAARLPTATGSVLLPDRIFVIVPPAVRLTFPRRRVPAHARVY